MGAYLLARPARVDLERTAWRQFARDARRAFSSLVIRPSLPRSRLVSSSFFLLVYPRRWPMNDVAMRRNLDDTELIESISRIRMRTAALGSDDLKGR